MADKSSGKSDLFSGHRISFWGDENVLELDSGDGCVTLRLY